MLKQKLHCFFCYLCTGYANKLRHEEMEQRAQYTAQVGAAYCFSKLIWSTGRVLIYTSVNSPQPPDVLIFYSFSTAVIEKGPRLPSRDR